MADILKYRKLDGTEVEVANNSTIALGHTEASIEFTVDLDQFGVSAGETRGWFSLAPTLSVPQISDVYGVTISPNQGQTVSVTIQTVDAKNIDDLQNRVFKRFSDTFTVSVVRASAPADSVQDSVPSNFLVYPDSDAALAIVNATFALTDSATTFGIVDSNYVHIRQNRDFDFLTNLPKTIDSVGITRSLFDSDVRKSINVTDAGGDGSLAYNNSTGIITYTGPSASEVRAHFGASQDLVYDASTGIFSIDVEVKYTKDNFDSDLRDRLTTTNTDSIAEGSNLYFTTQRARNTINVADLGGDGSLTYDSARGKLSYQGPVSSEVRAHFTGDKGIVYNDGLGIINIDSGNIRGMFSASGDLTYNTATGQFSFDVEQVYTKANFDSDLGDANTGQLPEGTNLYYTTARADSAFDASFALASTDSLSEGTNLYYTTARADSAARSAMVAVDAGGDGSFAYDSATGKFTYTGPSATEVRAHLSATDAGGDGSFSYNNSTGVLTYTGPSASEVRSHFSAQGDLTYDSATGVFQFDVEQVYTKANFDSDFNIAIDSASTSDLSEGTNLYYTTARFDTRLASKTTADLTEGSNLYYTTVRVDSDFDASFALASTDSLSEGTTNLYYTDARVNTAFDTRLATKNTGDLAEGSNLYYTNARADARVNLQTGSNLNLSSKSTSDLSEGTNKYYTTVRVDSDFDASFALASTDSLSEGSTNLYFTNTRADARVNAVLPNTGSLTEGSNLYHTTARVYAASIDSTRTIALINNAYVQARQIQYNTSDFLDSTTITGVVDNAYVQARQIQYNTSDFTDSAFVTGLPISTFTNDKNYLDSTYASALIDSAHIKAVVDSNYVQLIQADLQRDSSFISSIVTGGTLNMGANNIITTGKVLFANVYSQLSDLPSASTYHGMFAHVHSTGKGYFAHAGAWIELANNSQLSNSGNWNTAFGWGDHSAAGYQSAATALDSAMVYRFTIDSTRTTALVDAAYVQARQTSYNTSDFTDSAFVTGLPISTFTNDANYLDSTTITGVINTAYVRARQALIDSDLTKLLVDSAYIQLRDRFQDSSLVTSTIDSAYINARVSTVDSAAVQAIIDSSYLEVIIDSDYVTARAGVNLDSASIASGVILTTVDNAYVQARQIQYNTSDFTDSTFVTGLPVSTFTNDVQYLDSTTVQGVINATYVQANQNDYLDSTLTSQLIDSAYIALRTTSGTDSATVINLIDSDYISNRVVAFANPIFTEFKYVTDSAGQIVFEGNDANGNALSIETGNHSVFVNGIRLLPSDFTSDVTNNRITLDSTGAAADEIVISTIKGKNALAGIAIIDSDYISSRTIAVANPQFNNFRYIATSNQTAFTGSDVNSKALSITPSNFQIFLNGVRLLDSDFTADTDNNTITLSSGATASDELVVTTVIGQTAIAGIAAVDSAYVQARVAAGTDSSTVISLINDTVDSAYINARVSTVDSAQVLGIVDSDYIATAVPGVVAPTFTNFRYIADSGDTAFSGADINGKTLYLRTGNHSVFLNGIKLLDSDFTSNTATDTITLASSLDSADEVLIQTITGDIVTTGTAIDSGYVQARQEGVNATFKDYKFVATANQTVFSGNDANGTALSFEANKFHVLLNGIRLDASDFTESAGNNKITLATGAAVSDELIVSTIGTEKTTTLASITSTVDSAYVQARQVDLQRDSAYIANIVDSAYVQARQVDLQRDSAYIANIVDSALGTINVIGPSGPIVIGSSTPDTTISGGTPAMQVVGSGFNGTQSITRRDNGEYGPSLMLAKSRNTTPGSNTIVQDGDTLGGVIFIGDDGTDLDTYGASITAKVNGTPGANDMPTSLHFNINRGTSTPYEAFRVNHFTSTDNLLHPRSSFGWYTTGGNQRNVAMHVSGHRYYFPAMALEDYDGATAYAGTFVLFYRNNTHAGSITSTSASSVSYGTSSDYRMKSNVADLDSAINIVKSLKPKKFKWKSEDSADYDNPFVMGFIAHEADSAIPLSQGIVIGDKDETDSHGTPKMQSMDYGKMTPLVVKALQEALEKIETLEAKVAALEGGG